MSTVSVLLRAMRVRQWVKNVLVLAVPLAAGALDDGGVLVRTLVAGVAFCLVSSAVYLVNDIIDREVDRIHPVKRGRPIASGELGIRTAGLLAIVLAIVGLGASALCSWRLLLVVLSYVTVQLCYSVWLKHEPVLDLAVVASGFVLRAIAGGVATDIPISQWFLLVAGFGSLFIVAGKRYSELRAIGADAGTRRSLVGYTESYLRFVWGVAAGATLLTYALWAFEGQASQGSVWATISIAPFVLGVLRYSVDIDAARASTPEDIIWGDRVLQSIGLLWLVSLIAGVLHV